MALKPSLKESQFFLVANIVFLSVPIYLSVVIYRLFNGGSHDLPVFCTSYALEGIFIAFFLITALVCFGISKSKPSDHLSYYRVFRQYAMNSIATQYGKRLHKTFIRKSQNPEQAQAEWLMHFLKERKDTACGKDYGYNRIKSVRDFMEKVPLTEYDNYRKYAERAANGETNVLSKGKPDYIVLTSGTTGNNKMFPMTKALFGDFIKLGILLPGVAWGDRFPGRLHLKSQFVCLVLPHVMKHEKSGIRMGAFSGYFDMSYGQMTTPVIAFMSIRDENTLMYIHAVFGLLHEDVEILLINFVTMARSWFVTLENRWEDIVADIQSGTLNPSLNLTPPLKKRLEKYLWADPERARFLKKEFKRGFENIVPRVFPHVQMVNMTACGTLLTPSLTLQRKYFPSVPIVSGVHCGSEGLYGICLDPGNIVRNFFTMIPHQAFYEFIHVDDVPKSNPPTKLMHQLELNEQYELCMTTDRGLARYRTGDIIKVVSFYNKTPQYEFIGRYGQLLNVCGEKTSENTFNVALEDTLARLTDFSLVDYTTAENRTLDSSRETPESERYYILFIELEKKKPGVSSLTDQQKNMFDLDQQVYNESYKDLRNEGRIQQMKVIETRPGGFDAFKQWILDNNPKTSSIQYKTPRVLRNERQLQFMLGQAAKERAKETCPM